MSENIYQLYTINPTTTFVSTDLMYLGRSPYGTSDDFAFTYGSLAASIAASSGTVNAGTLDEVAYYAAAGNTISGISLSSLIDTVLGSTQGDVLYRNATTWTVLAPGAAGQFLTTGGTGANPSWTSADAVAWIDAGVSQTMASQTGYKTTGASLISLALPTTAAENTVIEVAGYGAGGWTITQGSGQQIIFSAQATTLGTGGSVSSTNRYDCLRLLCAVANTTFLVLSSVGNLTVV